MKIKQTSFTAVVNLMKPVNYYSRVVLTRKLFIFTTLEL